jgi:hypothetical protein
VIPAPTTPELAKQTAVELSKILANPSTAFVKQTRIVFHHGLHTKAPHIECFSEDGEDLRTSQGPTVIDDDTIEYEWSVPVSGTCTATGFANVLRAAKEESSKPLLTPRRPYPWIEFSSVSNGTSIQFVRLLLAVEDYPNTPIQKSLASLSSLENLHVKIVARVYTTQMGQGMSCTISEFRAPQWNNDNATTQPLVDLNIRPDATVLEIMASASNGRWNGTSVILNRHTYIDTDEYMTGLFLADAGANPLSTRRTMIGPISTGKVVYRSEPLTVPINLVNQGTEPVGHEEANAVCQSFIHH